MQRIKEPEHVPKLFAIYEFTNDKKINLMYNLFDTQTKKVVATYKNVKVARNARDKRNYEYGSFRYTVTTN